MKRVCVIGAGLAGLVAAKVLKQDGFDVVVFEKERELGGVWAASRTYPGLRANNSRESYAFSDFPYPDTRDAFPTAEQIRAYLNAYTDHFGLRSLICLSTEVVSVTRGAAHQFEVVVRPSAGNQISLEFAFVVVCNGVFSEPQMPRLDSQELFRGSIRHSSQLTDPRMVIGKRVVVVGAGKSALDCAGWAARHAQMCTLVFRSPRWMAPRYLFGRIRIDWVIFTRFFELFLPYHRQGRFEAFLHGPMQGFVRLWWRGWSRVIRRFLNIPAVLVPDAALPAGFENIGIGGEFYEALNLGKLDLRRARIARFVGADSLYLDTGETVEADVVVLATGWSQGFAFLAHDLLSLVRRHGRLWLYRHILPPQEPHVGFIGYASSTACQLTSEVAAHWLSQCFRGELNLPSSAEMDREIARVLKWTNEVFPARSEGYFVGPYLAHYLDDLLHDMNLPRRRAGNVFSEYFAPLWPHRYQHLAEQRQRMRPADRPVARRSVAAEPMSAAATDRGRSSSVGISADERSVEHCRHDIDARI
jgi:cation diffusion facilitator CzcD-associated flavoprotein CzcO